MEASTVAPPAGGSSSSVAFYKLFRHADGVDVAAMAVGGLASVAHGASVPVFLVVLGRLLNTLGSHHVDPVHMSKQVSTYALYFVYISLVRLGTGYVEVSLWMYTGERQASRLRTEFVRALLSQDVGFFDTNMSTGDVIASISHDMALIQDAIGTKTGNVIHYLSQFMTGMVVSFRSLWELSLLTLAAVPLIALSGGFCAYMIIGITARNQEAYSRAAEVALEVIEQMRTVHSFGGERKAFQAYSDALQSTKKLGIQAGLAKGLGVGSLYGVGICSFALLLWFSGKLIRNGITNGGESFTTILNIIASSLALGQASPDIATIGKAKVAGYTILEMIKRKPLISYNTDGLKLDLVSGNIELRSVCFNYPSRPDIKIFQNFSLFIPAGKVIAIVGPSGTGKSTVISLIERFYDPLAGEVLLDGHNIKTLQLKWLRDQMGLVNQEPALFATTIRENIMYGKAGNVPFDDVVKAASISSATTFIDALPDRYETQVGERGVQLSGGQKQRIAIARAIVKNPSILLLDEATSALDSDSEKSVQEALDRVMLGRTTVVVAHRLSTIQNADVIAVVQDGKVAELGSHNELIEKDSLYAALVKIQKNGPADSSRIYRGHLDSSLSQRTFSFGSNRSSVSGQGLQNNEAEPNIKNLVGPRPSLARLIRMNASYWPFGLLSAIGAIVAGAQVPVFALIISVISALAYTCEFYFTGVTGERVTLRVRKAMFSAILQNEVSWFDTNSSTLLASRLSADAPLVKTAIVDRVVTLLQNMGLIVAAFCITLTLQWNLSLIMIVTFPAVIGSYAGQMQFSSGFSGDLHMVHMKANVVAGEAISNIRTVAAFSAEEKVLNLFCKTLGESRKKAFVRGQIGGIGFGVSQFVLFCWCALALWYASVLIRKGQANFGETVKCFMVLLITAFSVAEALTMTPDFLRGTKTLQGVFQILDRRTEIDIGDPRAEEVHAVNGSIEFRHVHFSYPSRAEVKILNNFNLNVRRGYSQALVGASGSGKSSVIALIARFYDPQSGRVLIDGKDIKQLRLESLRRHIGLVQQEPALFSTSIYENIRYGKEGATESEIVEAAKAANAHGFISGLPGGYMTEVGERGVQLSGGQKQRVAIARAVLKNPAILLLDEATSALDMESEKLVQEALDKMMERRTTVLVAHRLSTVQNAHSIAVLENGSIKEQGNHRELIAKQGAYFQLHNLSG
ncbi:hypothetical protein GOP47_0021895 [Adiantum capillus-veneris]|uniref:Uncharacterized protein n=1 Tax=Adiantum capillus-veneris TaxID=13818 RepID=A0A9D4U996_ADICA|nr:hypothetical protein GOP47_0021895 [Adiantum capillus-veneris]